MRVILFLNYFNAIVYAFCLTEPKNLPSELFNFEISGKLKNHGQPIKVTFTGKRMYGIYSIEIISTLGGAATVF